MVQERCGPYQPHPIDIRTGAQLRYGRRKRTKEEFPLIRIALLAAAIGGMILLAAPFHSTWRLAGALSLLVSAVVLAAIGLPVHTDPYPKGKVWYTGSYPPLPSSGRATAWAKPEGLVLDFGRQRKRLIKYGRLAQAVVTHTDREGRRALFAYVDDAVTHALYPIWLVPKHPLDADRLLQAILRRNYENADLVWKAWRTMAIDLVVKPQELRTGVTREVTIQRKVACTQCGGIVGVSPRCRECAGEGAVLQDDVAAVVIPKGSRPGKEVILPELGHEDVNGYRGPLVVRLVQEYVGHAARP